MPKSLHVVLIDASLGDTHVQRNFTRELEAELTIVRVSEGDALPSLSTNGHADVSRLPFDAIVISGSQSSVYDDRPWIARLATWTRRGLNAGLPVLGVCWGHQLLAQMMGGTVEARGRYELGYVDIVQDASDALFSGLLNPFVAFATHSDEVTTLPEGGVALARNEAGVQAFRKEHAYGVQFHPEYDMRTARDMIQRKDLPMRKVQAALDTVTEEHVRAAQSTKQILSNFLRIAAMLRAERNEA